MAKISEREQRLREALYQIFVGDDMCGCDCDGEECCMKVQEFCPHCIARAALAMEHTSGTVVNREFVFHSDRERIPLIHDERERVKKLREALTEIQSRMQHRSPVALTSFNTEKYIEDVLRETESA